MLDEDELSTYPVQYTDQVRNLSVVSEPGLYSLILRSRKPEAKAFKRWVTHEVIPSIRKTGGYLIAKPDDTPEAILARAVLVAQDTIRRIEAERDEAIRTKAEIGSRREATAMATASAAVRKAAALENELGRGRDYKSVKGIPWFLDVFADTPAPELGQHGQELADYRARPGGRIGKVFPQPWDSGHALPVNAVAERIPQGGRHSSKVIHGIRKLCITLLKGAVGFHRISPRPRCRHGVSEVRDTAILPRLADGGEDFFKHPLLKYFCRRQS